MNSKKGISLIVLVITIIVIIILAAAVVMSLNNNNVLTNSRRAVNESDFAEVEGAWNIAMQAVTIKQLDSVVISGEITSAGFNGTGFAGDKATATGDTISDATETVIEAITIASLDLPSTFTNIVIADNRVIAIVKNGQLMEKNEGVLSIIEANFTANSVVLKTGSQGASVVNRVIASDAWTNAGSELGTKQTVE